MMNICRSEIEDFIKDNFDEILTDSNLYYAHLTEDEENRMRIFTVSAIWLWMDEVKLTKR